MASDGNGSDVVTVDGKALLALAVVAWASWKASAAHKAFKDWQATAARLITARSTFWRMARSAAGAVTVAALVAGALLLI